MSPVRVVLDLQALQVDGIADRGIGRYTIGFTAALARAGRVAAGLLAPELPPPAGLPAELVDLDLVRWDEMAVMRDLLRREPSLVHHTLAPFLHTEAGDPSVLVTAPHWARSGLPRVVTLYDLIPLRAPRHYLHEPGRLERYRARAEWVSRADLILAISDHTRREAIELLGCDPSRVTTVGAGVSPYFSPPDGGDLELFRFHLGALEGRSFVLTVAGSDARKGAERLVMAVAEIVHAGRDLHLVVVGDLTTAWRQRLAALAQQCGVGDRVRLIGAVGDDLLRACYRRAAVTVMPSLAEGSGLPVLESAACGTPALASCTTALGQAAATAKATFDPSDTSDVSAAIERLLADGHLRSEILLAQQQQAAGCTWDAAVERAIAALDQLDEGPQVGARHHRGPPTRLALVGPMPPEGGGIGAYNARFLGSLPDGVEADSVTATEIEPGGWGDIANVTAESFGVDVRPCAYDAVIYTLGNSHGHLATVELALRHPGWLWLHEVRLPAIATTALEQASDSDFSETMSQLLRRAYPGRAPFGAARRAGRSTRALLEAGVGLIPPLAERCRGVLVNSEAARRLLLVDLPPLGHHPPIHVVPPACPPLRPPSSVAFDRGPPVVVSFGIVSVAKRPDLLVDAAAAAGCRLAFVGPCPPVLREVIVAQAELRGSAGRVEVTGGVSAQDWQAWLDRATLAVQLREPGSGETSAALLEALSAGVPVLTDLAAAAEYPAGTVSWLASSRPDEIAARIEGLLGAPDALLALSEGGRAFAAEHQFSNLASRVMALVAGHSTLQGYVV